MVVQTNIIQVDGRDYESANLTKQRLKISENALNALLRLSRFPAPVRIGRVRYFASTEIDSWVEANNR